MAGKKLERIHSYFDFNRRKLIHEVHDMKISSEYKNGDSVPSVHIGNCIINNHIEV